MSIRSILALAAVAAMLAGASGCSSHSTPPSITVFVAASLRETFKDLARRFEADNPGTSVVLHFAGSSDLLAQLSHGAVADAFAAGDADIMGIAAHAGLLAAIPIDFASNNLVIVVAPGNPLNIRSFSDLNRDGLSVVACAPIVPCGWAAQRIEDNTGVQLHLMSEESSVTDVLTKVMNGQADAGLVYVTDALAAGNAVRMVQFAQSSDAVNICSIAVLANARNAGMANRFIAVVAGNDGRDVLSRAGFAKPF